MNRRSFLASLIGAAAAAYDPERLLWVPGAKIISIPNRWKVWELDGQRLFWVYSPSGYPTYEMAWMKHFDSGKLEEHRLDLTVNTLANAKIAAYGAPAELDRVSRFVRSKYPHPAESYRQSVLRQKRF